MTYRNDLSTIHLFIRTPTIAQSLTNYKPVSLVKKKIGAGSLPHVLLRCFLVLQVSQLITRIEGLEKELSVAKQKGHDEINEQQVTQNSLLKMKKAARNAAARGIAIECSWSFCMELN